MSVRLRYFTQLNPSKSEAGDLSKIGNATFAPMEAIADGLGGLDTSLEKPAAELASGSYSYFAEGDILLAKVTPCFENGKKALVSKLPNGIGFATSEVHVIRPLTDKIHPNFLRYLLSCETFRAAGIASMTGAGGLKRVSENAIRDFPVQITNFETQRSIADFLDRETAHIEHLVEKKAQLLELLDQRFRNFAAHTTTRGINASELVSSRIDWNPFAPATWEVRRMADLFSESMELGGEDLPILSVSINTGISDRELGDEDRQRMVNHIEDRNAYKRVRVGDLVYNMMRAWQGGFGVAKVDGLVSPAYVVARPKVELYAPYFEYVTRTPNCIEQFRRASKGIADFRQRLYWEHFRQVRIAIPPFGEQKQIADALDWEAARTSPIRALTQQSIDRLREYRAALITAAVTGQIDVSKHVRKGHTDRRLDAIEAEMRA